MPVLFRGREEWLCIGDNIYLKILGVSENQLRIGIKAPPEKIHREEVVFALKPIRREYSRLQHGARNESGEHAWTSDW